MDCGIYWRAAFIRRNAVIMKDVEELCLYIGMIENQGNAKMRTKAADPINDGKRQR